MVTAKRQTTKAHEQRAIARQKRAQATVLSRLNDSTGAFFERKEAGALEEAAQAVLTPPGVVPLVRGGGEALAIRHHDPGDHDVMRWLEDTLQNPTLTAATASFDRLKLLLPLNCLELALDVAETVQPQNSVERMLCHQLAAVHTTALTLLEHSQHYRATPVQRSSEATVEACRLVNAAVRCMSVFESGLLTLQKLRTGGKQTVVVQHVHVSEGGQAVVTGDMITRGGCTPGAPPQNGGTIPCPEPLPRPGRRRAAKPTRARA